jgi:hypothetical protein
MGIGWNLSLPSANTNASSASGNASISQTDAWEMVNAANTHVKQNVEFWRRVWTSLQAAVPAAFVDPPSPGKCRNLDGCIGQQGGLANKIDCVCYRT